MFTLFDIYEERFFWVLHKKYVAKKRRWRRDLTTEQLQHCSLHAVDDTRREQGQLSRSLLEVPEAIGWRVRLKEKHQLWRFDINMVFHFFWKTSMKNYSFAKFQGPSECSDLCILILPPCAPRPHTIRGTILGLTLTHKKIWWILWILFFWKLSFFFGLIILNI